MTPDPDVAELGEVIKDFSVDQIKFIVARQGCSTDRAAAEAIGVSPETVKSWKRRGVPIDAAAQLMAVDYVSAAMELRRRALIKAMTVKVGGLDSTDEGQRQRVATEIIEWEMGKATQRQELTGPAGGPIVIIDWDEPADSEG